MRYSSSVVALLLLLGLLGTAHPASAAVTYTFNSEGFAAVGNGESGTFTDADGPWSVTGRGNLSTIGLFNGIRLGFTQDSPPPGVEPVWILIFENADTSELEVGTYNNLGSTSDPTKASMSIENDITCTGDDDPLNSFTVSAIEYDLYGRPIRFAATFVLRCTPGGQALTGSIDYTFDGNLDAPGFTPGNVLVTLDSIIYEYTTAGTQVQALPVGRGPAPPTFFGLHRKTGGTSYEPARDLAMTDDGVLHLYNEQSNLGQFTFADRLSRLSSLDPSGVWQHNIFDAEWNTSNSLESGLAVLYPHIVTIDGPTSGDARGIVQFDSSNAFAAQRLDSGSTFYVDVAAGLDGTFYVLQANGTTVDIYNPATGAVVPPAVTLDASVNAIAVNAAGTIFGVGGSNELTIYAFDSDGNTQSSLDLEVSPGLTFGLVLTDIDVSSSGAIAIGLLNNQQNNGEIVLTDESLVSAALVELDPSPNQGLTFVAFAVTSERIFSDGFESGDATSWSSASP